MMLAGIVLLAACKRSPYELSKGEVPSADTARVDSIPAFTQDKLVKTASINFKVKNVQRCAEQIGAIADHYHAIVMHHDITSTAGVSKDYKFNSDSVTRISSYETRGEMTVKVPEEKLEAFTDSVCRLGIYVNRSLLNIEDKSLDYLATRMKADNRAKLVSQRRAGKVTIKSPTAVMNLEDDLVDERIENLKTDRDVKYSAVSLSFYQNNTILKELLLDDNPSAYDLPFFKRFTLAFANGWWLFTELIIAVANIWMLLVVAAITFVLVRNYKIKHRNATPSA